MRYGVLNKLVRLNCAADIGPLDLSGDGGDRISSALQTGLEAIDTSQSVILPDNIFGLRTRQPRRQSTDATASASTTGPYQLSFGGVGRSRTPSKKNVVLELADGRSAAEWSRVEYFPPFQIGKMQEDHFSLDFSHLSPVQAFAIALVVFDQ